ncbi:hypothetical protein VPNG_09052 [Cytospora leucostoma]|uniref:DUF7514 domain-containing protein n=1 Tax=Cytospora leucostoma TaxID=1230097 RepID=A0A423VZ91_9PEZI|nr:hypothetical protein VPNG_09052 [Cytospora leucostoma]
MSGIPSTTILAATAGVLGSAWISGGQAMVSMLAVPGLLSISSSVPSQLLAQQWAGIYSRGKVLGPRAAVVSLLGYGYLVYDRSRQDRGWGDYVGAMALTIGIVPFTLIFMVPTNQALLGVAEGASTLPSEAVRELITEEIGDKQDQTLNPTKLAAFYRAVGGDYDRLFINAPHESISYIWQVFGCQHTLQPTENDFEAPNVPALTLRGFVRWESIQVLLNPEEHVPFIKDAVKNWHLRDPDTGEPFPEDIPDEAFPTEPDPDISAWHAACGDKLRQEATPQESPKDTPKDTYKDTTPKDSPTKDSPKPAFKSAEERLRDAYSHIPAGGGPPVPPTPRPRPPVGLGSDYFNHRPALYTHVNPGNAARYPRGPPVRVSPERVERTRKSGSSAEDMAREERARRRSFSDYPSPTENLSSVHLNPGNPGNTGNTSRTRRHSHPRGHSSDESDSEGNMSPRSRRSSGHHGTPARGPKVVPRFAHVAPPATGSPNIPPAVPNAPPGVQIPSIRTESGSAKVRSDDRDSSASGGRRKSAPFVEGATNWAKDKFDKFSTMLPGYAAEKPVRRHPGSSGSGSISMDRVDRLSRDSLAASAVPMSRSYSYEGASDRDAPPADWDDRPRDRGKEDTRHEAFDVRERDRYAGEERRRRVDDRGRERVTSPGMKGVGGRRYPGDPPWVDD